MEIWRDSRPVFLNLESPGPGRALTLRKSAGWASSRRSTYDNSRELWTGRDPAAWRLAQGRSDTRITDPATQDGSEEPLRQPGG